MTTENPITANPFPPRSSSDLHDVLEVIARWEKESRDFAAWLDQQIYVHALYGVLDGLSLSYSMIKYLFDLLYANTLILSSDAMHEWLLTPDGIAFIVPQTAFLIGFSLLANIYSDSGPNVIKRNIAYLWPLVRDSLKALKNAYKGLRAALLVAGSLSNTDLRYLIAPLGIVLGCLSAADRLFLRYVVKEERKARTKLNAQLLAEIMGLNYLSFEQSQTLRDRILSQAEWKQVLALVAAWYGGIIDGFYLYMGAVSLVVVAPTVFAAMAGLCTLYSLSCVAIRLYEEYDFQRRFLITQVKIELALCCKELESRIVFLRKQVGKNPYLTPEEQGAFQKAIQVQWHQLESKRAQLESLVTLSSTSAFFSGLKDGVAAYGVLASAVFSLSAMYSMLVTPLSPLLVVGCVYSGVVCMFGFIAYSLYVNASHRNRVDPAALEFYQQVREMLDKLQNDPAAIAQFQDDEARKRLAARIKVTASPRNILQQLFEDLRSFFAGISKGQKAISFLLNGQLALGADAHYHETPVMFYLAILCGGFNAAVFFLRAHAKGFGRDDLDAAPKPASPVVQEDVSIASSPTASTVPATANDTNAVIFPNNISAAKPVLLLVPLEVEENALDRAQTKQSIAIYPNGPSQPAHGYSTLKSSHRFFPQAFPLASNKLPQVRPWFGMTVGPNPLVF